MVKEADQRQMPKESTAIPAALLFEDPRPTSQNLPVAGWGKILEIGNTQLRIESAQARHGLLRFCEPPYIAPAAGFGLLQTGGDPVWRRILKSGAAER